MSSKRRRLADVADPPGDAQIFLAGDTFPD
jgi:hypothetical protein